MVEAQRVHQEIALLSNRLADFADDDGVGRKAVVDQILEKRELWKDYRFEIETGQPRRAPVAEKPTTTQSGLSEAEIRVELSRIRANISKYKDKLEERPDHKKAGEWDAELQRLIGLREAYEAELATLKYQSSTSGADKTDA